MQDMLVVAKVLSSHGLHGAVRLKSFTQDPETLFSFAHLLCEKENKMFRVKTRKPTKDASIFLVRFEGVTSRNDSDTLKGLTLCVEKGMLPDVSLEEDVFYHADLIGVKALALEEGWEGTVRAIHHIGESDVLEILPLDQAGDKTSHMIPFTKAFVPEINLKEGVILFRVWDKKDPKTGGKSD